MNIPVLMVGCITLLALIAHIFGGTLETKSIKPDANDEKKIRSWKQVMCAFQMLAVDLGVVTILLFLISLTEIIPFEHEVIFILSLLYLLWGIVWLVQLFCLNSHRKTYLILPQWLLWFGCSALLYYGAQ